MKIPTSGAGEAHHRPAGPEIARPTKAQDHHHGNGERRHGREELPTVAGELLAPAGRRHLPALLVRRCPACLCAHLHRGGPGIRRPPCGGSEYRVVALSVEGIAA